MFPFCRYCNHVVAFWIYNDLTLNHRQILLMSTHPYLTDHKQTHAMLQRSMPCCQSSLLPVWFWMQLGMLRETQHRFLGTLLELFFYMFLKVRRFPVAEKMAGSRPRCPTSRKLLRTVLDTGVMFHENAEAANDYNYNGDQPLELVYTVPKLAVQYQCTYMHFRSNSFHDSLHG